MLTLDRIARFEYIIKKFESKKVGESYLYIPVKSFYCKPQISKNGGSSLARNFKSAKMEKDTKSFNFVSLRVVKNNFILYYYRLFKSICL
jgi:hypothetical protein